MSTNIFYVQKTVNRYRFHAVLNYFNIFLTVNISDDRLVVHIESKVSDDSFLAEHQMTKYTMHQSRSSGKTKWWNMMER